MFRLYCFPNDCLYKKTKQTKQPVICISKMSRVILLLYRMLVSFLMYCTKYLFIFAVSGIYQFLFETKRILKVNNLLKILLSSIAKTKRNRKKNVNKIALKFYENKRNLVNLKTQFLNFLIILSNLFQDYRKPYIYV